jgi:hypothetical protein
VPAVGQAAFTARADDGSIASDESTVRDRAFWRKTLIFFVPSCVANGFVWYLFLVDLALRRFLNLCKHGTCGRAKLGSFGFVSDSGLRRGGWCVRVQAVRKVEVSNGFVWQVRFFRKCHVVASGIVDWRFSIVD